MDSQNFKKNYCKKILKPNGQKSIGRAHLTEPIIISGKYFGIKLLSTYEFMQCLKMKTALLNELLDKDFDKNICSKICECACLVSMCLYTSKNNRIFKTALEALQNLTPEELKFVYKEYSKLLNKVITKDKTTQSIVEKAKKYYHS